MQLPDLGVRTVPQRVDGALTSYRARWRRCTCDQKLQQSLDMQREA